MFLRGPERATTKECFENMPQRRNKDTSKAVNKTPNSVSNSSGIDFCFEEGLTRIQK